MSMQQVGILGQHEVKRIRQSEGKFYRGDWIYNESPDEEIIKCSVQELSKVTMGKKVSTKLLKELEGDRTTSMIKLYAPLHTFQEADDTLGISADIIEWRGRLHEVSAVNHWQSAQALSHDEVYAQRIDDDINRHDT